MECFNLMFSLACYQPSSLEAEVAQSTRTWSRSQFEAKFEAKPKWDLCLDSAETIWLFQSISLT